MTSAKRLPIDSPPNAASLPPRGAILVQALSRRDSRSSVFAWACPGDTILPYMHSMRDLLDRALAWPRRALGDQPEITDPIKLHFFHISVRLKAEDILTPEEVAARLKVPESWVYEKTRVRCRNPIPCLRLGRYIRCDWLAVIAWLTAASVQEQSAGKTSPPAKRSPVRSVPRG